LARALIVGCGCRGRELAAQLASLGWQVRGTSRRADGLDAIGAAGFGSASADPDRPGTVLELCGDVTVVVWLLGDAFGEAETTSAIHGSRLRSLLEKLVDGPVRGFVYEAAGSVDGETLAEGARIVEDVGGRWRIPVTLLGDDRRAPGWAERTAAAVAGLLTG
jgi:nucleoside-diphosphate-sugar epimerase